MKLPEQKATETVYSRPYRTTGRKVWWVPDSFWNRNDLPLPQKPAGIVYRDGQRTGVWLEERWIEGRVLRLLEREAATPVANSLKLKER